MKIRQRLVSTIFVLAAVVAVACGGALAGGDAGGDAGSDASIGACPSNQRTSCSAGQTCTSTYPNCPGEPPGILTCDCLNGFFACAQPGAPRCPDEPPVEPCGFAGAVSNGESCPPSEKGITCGSIQCPYVQSVKCTCNGNTFQCGQCPPDAGTDAGPG